MIFEVKCDEERTNELTDRTHTRIVSFIVLDLRKWEERNILKCSMKTKLFPNIGE